MKMFKNKLERIASLLGLFALFFYFASPASANTNPIDSVAPVLSASVDSVVDAYSDYVLDPAIVTIEKSNAIFAKLIEDTTSSLSNHYDNYTSGLALLIAPDTKSEKPAKNLGMSLTANPLTETSDYLFNLYFNNFISPLSDTWLTVLNFSKNDKSEPVNISEVAPTNITNTITPSVTPAKPEVKPNSPITYITNSNRGPQGIAGPQGPRGLQGIAGISNIDASLFVSRIDFDNQVDRIFNSIENGLEDVSSGGGGSGDALTTNPLSQFASTTSAELAGVISNESGTGVLVFANTPTLITPVLGAATGTSLTLSSLSGSGTRCVQVDNSGVLAIAGAACGAGGGQTPWTSDIDADNFKLLDLGTNITARADLTVTATSADLNLATATSGNITLAPASTGSIQVTSGVTTGTGTSSGLSVVANSLTTGVGVNLASSSLSSGSLLNLAVTGTAGLDNQKGINVSMSGANGTGAQTTYGGYFSNTHTGTSINVGLYATASGGSNNYAAIFNSGSYQWTFDPSSFRMGMGPVGNEFRYLQIYADSGVADFSTLSDTGDMSFSPKGSTKMYINGTSGDVGIGTVSPDARLELAGNQSQAAWGLNGIQLQGTAATYTDTSSSGTVASAVANSLGIPTFAASSATTYTASANLYIAGPPTSGTNVAQSNPYALWVDSGNVRIDGTLGYNGDLDSYLNFGTGELRSSSSLTIRSRNGEGILLDGSGNSPAGGGARISLGGNSVGTGDAGADEVVFYNGGAETMSIDAAGLATFAGDVQIGGTSNPQGLLLYQDSGSNGFRLADTADGDNIIAQLSQVSDKGYLFLDGDSGSGIELFGSSAAPSYIDAGNFGIGTTAPDRKMEINSATGINLRLTYNDADGSATNYADLLTTSSGDLSVVPSGGDVGITGNLGITSTNTTQTTTASALALNVNSLTTGTGLNIASSSLSSGSLLNLAVTGTAGINNQKGINVSMSGANGTGAQTTYGGYFSNTHTGTSTNVGLYATASGGSNNYAAIFEAGNVGIGTTAPSASLHIIAPTSDTINVAIFKGNYAASDYPVIYVNNGSNASTIGFNTYEGNEYAIGVNTSHDFIISSGRALASSPIVTFSDIGDIDILSQDLGNGTAGPVITLGRNTNATNTGAGSINFQSKGGTAGYVWQDNAGNMRIHTAVPSNANDTAGTVIGTQTSTRNTKQDIEDYSDYNGALSMVLGIPLHTFRYKKDVEGYGENSILAKTRIGYMADEVPGDFMWGNSIDQVSVNGILLASIKALDLKITDINNLEEENDWRDNLVAWFANAENRITRIFTGEICLTDPGEEAVCLNRTELQGLKGLLNGQISTPEYTPPPASDPTPEPTPEPEATPESEPADTGQEEETPPPADEAPPAPEPSPEPAQ